MASLNKVMLIGNLTRDAELRYIPSGSAVLDFRLAVNRKFKRQDGTEVDETLFVDVSLWGKRGEAVAQYLTKGKPLFVEGRLQMDEWDDKETGQKRSKLRIVAENIEFLGGGQRQEGGGPGAARGGEEGGAPQQRSYGNGGARGGYGGGGGGGYGSGGGYPGAGNGQAPAREPYARPASAPTAVAPTAPAVAPTAALAGAVPSTASAMQLRDEDIPF